ncbi:MAG: DoxX family protein [Candidatus Thioglobus sp.]|uniref:DoxX family protein n=1 Tax=Candidatus Thioglobus sp. TaxID=2026721 RepID=UPI002607E81C|nr:DoxX family protein [Candidatus Thioglobus sp.]MDC9727376.1 DoxX family protein [Candidatus Thioglobus sp.]
MEKIINIYNKVFAWIYKYTDDIFKLFVRLYVADAFFRAGWLKINSWDSTLYLFESEYQVPIIPWELAAYLATAVEIILPIFLILGLATRLIATKLFFFNIIAVISYPVIWQSGFYDHKLWGIMLLITIIYGPGKFSIDTSICQKLNKKL